MLCSGVNWALSAIACSVMARLEREYALSEGRAAVEAGGLLLPRHDRATFSEFVRWLGRGDDERVGAVDQVWMAVRTLARTTAGRDEYLLSRCCLSAGWFGPSGAEPALQGAHGIRVGFGVQAKRPTRSRQPRSHHQHAASDA